MVGHTRSKYSYLKPPINRREGPVSTPGLFLVSMMEREMENKRLQKVTWHWAAGQPVFLSGIFDANLGIGFRGSYESMTKNEQFLYEDGRQLVAMLKPYNMTIPATKAGAISLFNRLGWK